MNKNHVLKLWNLNADTGTEGRVNIYGLDAIALTFMTGSTNWWKTTCGSKHHLPTGPGFHGGVYDVL